MSQPDAEKRVNDVIVEAKAAADRARKGAAKLAFWLEIEPDPLLEWCACRKVGSTVQWWRLPHRARCLVSVEESPAAAE
jgi:hypothetical protein